MTEIIELRCAIVGPFVGVDDAILCEEPIDAAILDIRLGEEPSFPIADSLRHAAILFLTGQTGAAPPPRFAGASVYRKRGHAAILLENLQARHGIRDSILRIVMASRKGQHFGQFKAYLAQLMNQAVAGTTFLNTREIKANVLRRNEIDRATASQVAGLQLADVLVSAFFQSIERASPHYGDKVARCLLSLMAERAARPGVPTSRANEGVTFYPSTRVAKLLTEEQSTFFAHFGYDMDALKGRKAVNHVQALSQAERMWSQGR